MGICVLIVEQDDDETGRPAINKCRFDTYSFSFFIEPSLAGDQILKSAYYSASWHD